MRNVIHQSVVLPATAEALFDQYTNAELHAAVTGAPVIISAERGSEFRAFDGVLWGTVLETIRPRLVIQSWRSSAFEANDPESTLVLCFSNEGDQGRIDLVHLDVPEHDFQGVTEGWEKYYWEPWRNYLCGSGNSV